MKKNVFAVALLFALMLGLLGASANAQTQTSTSTNTGTGSMGTGVNNSTTNTTTPGLPNTGAGGDALVSTIVLLGSGLAVLGGSTFLTKKALR